MGILSIMDILGLFVDMMGLIHSSSRIDVEMENHPENIDAVSEIIQNHDINIISVGMSPHPTKKDRQVYLFRLDLCDHRPPGRGHRKGGIPGGIGDPLILSLNFPAPAFRFIINRSI